MPATQFNMKVGGTGWGWSSLIFLGLKTLTVIQNAVDQILDAGRNLHVAADGTELYHAC